MNEMQFVMLCIQRNKEHEIFMSLMYMYMHIFYSFTEICRLDLISVLFQFNKPNELFIFYS